MRRFLAGFALGIVLGAAGIAVAQRVSPSTVFPALTVTGLTTLSGQLVVSPTSQTIADEGTGAAATGTITYTTGVHQVTCSDEHGCAMTLSETGAAAGNILVVINVSASNALTFADSAGVQIVPSTTCTLATATTISFLYANSQWQVIAHTASCA